MQLGEPVVQLVCRPVLSEETTWNQMMKSNEIAWKGLRSSLRSLLRIIRLLDRHKNKLELRASCSWRRGERLITQSRWGFLAQRAAVWVRMERWGWGIPLTLCTAGDTAALLSWKQQQSPPPAWAHDAHRHTHTHTGSKMRYSKCAASSSNICTHWSKSKTPQRLLKPLTCETNRKHTTPLWFVFLTGTQAPQVIIHDSTCWFLFINQGVNSSWGSTILIYSNCPTQSLAEIF